ncbi:MAG TPA: sugar porter family MFS transporter [Segeticoccus sp.]|uniref:sugar porter family MFS transporter n=1 Tax=Segeticoccus sp. TaxID=2706531 RepID=UPI002D7EA6EA|nr:sugar porter family MFS transporter [Segeticoccus sp.]HET8598727.1 sugar porter family MFS transporter [Segeticoccus sp.]
MSELAQSSRDVLKQLDERSPSAFYWQLTLLATLGGFLFGYDTSNIGSALNFVPYGLTGFAEGYLVAGASIGAAVGAICAGPLTDKFGRKSLLIADAGIYAAGAILSAVTPDAIVLLIARTLIGLAIGADSAIATAYISEYAPRSRRGQLSMLQQWMITVGILVSYIVAIIVFKALPESMAYSVDWRLILGLGAIPALVGLALRTQMPESPRWLLRHDRYEDVRKAVSKLGLTVSRDDVEFTAHRLEEAESERRQHQSSQWTKGVKRALFVVCIFFVFQQITGINVPLYYGPHLLAPLFQGAHATKVTSTIAGVEVTAIMTAVNVAATYFGFRYIDRLGRRKISMGGYTGMIVFALLAAAGLGFLSGTAEIFVVMVGLSLFIASFAVGVGGTGWLLQGEVFPTAVRGQAAAYGATADWVANFALIEVFPVWQAGIGLPWVLVCFAGLSVMAIAFIFRYVPETKGLSVEEITHVFERQAASGGR